VPSRYRFTLAGCCFRSLLFAAVAMTAPANHDRASATPAPPSQNSPTVRDAIQFTDAAEKRLVELRNKASHANWVYETYITDDTEQMSADAEREYASGVAEMAEQAHRFEGLNLPPEVARKLRLLRLSVSIPVPHDPALAAELSKINASMSGDYGKGKWCPDGPTGKCLDINDVTRVFATSRDPNELLRAWRGWHAVGSPMRQRYARMVELANQGTRELGFPDTGAMWRSRYDMPPDQFAAEVDRLWQQVRPLYVSLHAYVRWKLAEKYGSSVVREDAPIPAHLLGNIWAQDWTNVYPLVAPKNSDPGYDLTKILVSRNIGSEDMARYAEHFFTSLGFAPLPQTFWERSMFVKPRDREVVCHASAWDVDDVEDLRVKVCLEPNADDFSTIHHEEGHNFYQRAYSIQPPLFRGSANDGFHEAIGDTIALSVTPEYLKQIGFLETVPPASADTGLLLNRALEKVAFLPFGLMIDKWRWGVFSGKIPPSEYNKAWWDLRRGYEGVAPPIERTEADFDPGAKFHIPANVPYARYFLSYVLQFQFHRALCRVAGYTGPLHRCSIYGNRAAGEKLARMLEMGASRPWPEALEAMTGEKDIDATALLDYFAPLKQWLDAQNEHHQVGW
jgi:peptidyl-dipeptidase A